MAWTIWSDACLLDQITYVILIIILTYTSFKEITYEMSFVSEWEQLYPIMFSKQIVVVYGLPTSIRTHDCLRLRIECIAMTICSALQFLE